MIYIGIVGSRRRNEVEDFLKVETALKVYFSVYPEITVVSGGCKKGADKFAEDLIEKYNLPKIIHLPDKSKLDPILLKKNPRAAYAIINYERNTLIANDSDILIACVAFDRKGGTEDTIKKYIKMGKKELVLV